MYETCEACVTVRKPYNLLDDILIHLPFTATELSVVDTPRLNNSQAIILILRECLNADNPLRRGLEGLNSRQTFMSVIHDILSLYALPVVWERLIDLNKEPN